VFLHFGAVDWEAKVWVNGKSVGEHRGGYDAFSFDVTEHLKKTGEQEVVVGVWDPTDAGTQPRGKQVNNPGGIYYTPITGIWQTVWLEPVPEVSIASLKLLPDAATGDVVAQVQLRGEPRKGHTLVGRIAEDGKALAKAVDEQLNPPALLLRAGKPKLWSPESPTLYDLTIDLVGPGGVVHDSVQSYCGFRTVGVGKDDKGVMRLLLNGKPYFQVGPLDQGFWPDGLYTAPTDEALRFDLDMTKKLGFNMTRKHVKVEPARWYAHCDRLGLLVWQDMPSGDRSIRPDQPDIQRSEASAKQYELELKRMIDQLHNSPAVIMWVVFNEGWGQFDTARITNWTKEYDPTRLVNNASGWADRKVGDVMDIHVYPGPRAPRPEEKRAGVLGEYGGFGLGIEGHSWSQTTWGYLGTRDRAELQRSTTGR
jgi:beta-galactosidase/beta-glucuronidase